MEISGTGEFQAGIVPVYDRAKEVKAFDETKTGVKGLVDAGVVKIPRIFIRPPDEIAEDLVCDQTQFKVPVIDLQGMEKDDRRMEIVDEIRDASETWGFFQIVNHGVPLSVMDEMIQGVHRFNEQDVEVKKQFYTRDHTRKVRFECNYDLLHSRTANWRDTLNFAILAPDPINPDDLPATCREITIEYTKYTTRLGDTLLELLSEALGLKPDHLKGIGCGKGCTLTSHYYPACPEPELTMGSTKHSDPTFLTVLLQDGIGGLQVLHQHHWVNVNPFPGALVVNIGDLLQLISNDKFKSVEHRVTANRIGPRISIACFFSSSFNISTRLYGPIKELLSEDSPPKYKDILMEDFIACFLSKGLDTGSVLTYFKL